LGFGKRNPLQALEFVEKLNAAAPVVLILQDYHRFLDHLAIAHPCPSSPKNHLSIHETYTPYLVDSVNA
jgi:hypothetical protein